MQPWNSMVFQNGFPLWLQVASGCYLPLSQTAPNFLASFRQWGELLPVFFPTRDLCCAHLIRFITPVGSTINQHLCFHMIRNLNMDAIIVATKFKCSALLLFSWAVTGCMMLFYSRNNSSCASAALSQSMYKLKRIRTKTHNPIDKLWTLLQY